MKVCSSSLAALLGLLASCSASPMTYEEAELAASLEPDPVKQEAIYIDHLRQYVRTYGRSFAHRWLAAIRVVSDRRMERGDFEGVVDCEEFFRRYERQFGIRHSDDVARYLDLIRTIEERGGYRHAMRFFALFLPPRAPEKSLELRNEDLIVAYRLRAELRARNGDVEGEASDEKSAKSLENQPAWAFQGFICGPWIEPEPIETLDGTDLLALARLEFLKREYAEADRLAVQAEDRNGDPDELREFRDRVRKRRQALAGRRSR